MVKCKHELGMVIGIDKKVAYYQCRKCLQNFEKENIEGYPIRLEKVAYLGVTKQWIN